MLCESTLAALEQRQAWTRRGGLVGQGPDGFTDQLGLAAPAGCRNSLQRALEIVGKVHGRLLHAIHGTIRGRRGSGRNDSKRLGIVGAGRYSSTGSGAHDSGAIASVTASPTATRSDGGAATRSTTSVMSIRTR